MPRLARKRRHSSPAAAKHASCSVSPSRRRMSPDGMRASAPQKGPEPVSHPAPLPPSRPPGRSTTSAASPRRPATPPRRCPTSSSSFSAASAPTSAPSTCSAPTARIWSSPRPSACRPDSVGRVRMRLDEGLAGLVAEELRPLVVDDAPAHPRFKYFKEAGEDPYHSFLGVPLVDRGLLQGVLVVQTVEPRAFDPGHGRGHQRRPGTSSRTSSARPAPWGSSSRRRRSACGAWPATCGGAGTRTRPASSATSIRACGAQLDHNPIALLQQMPVDDDRRARLAAGAAQPHQLRLPPPARNTSASRDTWGERHAGVLRARPVAYFSAEFGLHESLPIYSGGLGVLAGDHIKAASDLGIPLVGVGLYYDQGYFRQRLDDDGCASRRSTSTSTPRRCRSSRRRRKDGQPVTVSVETRTGTISARVWTLPVGRNTLLLLDSDVEGNPPEDRELTARLYGGDERARIRQELLLGVGGVRALRALGITPGVAHLNEGHSAFAALELARAADGARGPRRRRSAARGRLADRLHHAHAGAGRPRPLLARPGRGAPRAAARRAGHRPRASCSALGRVDPHNAHETFCMTVLALKLSRRANAVSALHGQVSRAMWTGALPGPDRGARPDRPHHQRRPRPHVAGAADAPALRPPPRRRLAAALRRAGQLGGDRQRRRRRAVGDAPDAARRG